MFDDPDAQSFETTRLVYSFLADLGFRTTIGIWPLGIRRKPNSDGETCGNAEYRAFLQHLQGLMLGTEIPRLLPGDDLWDFLAGANLPETQG